MSTLESADNNFPALTIDGQLRIKRAAFRERHIEPEYIQAFVTNVVAPLSLEEVYDTVVTDCPYWLTMDDILYACRNEPTVWTVPRWAKKGDVVFFMHSKTSNSRLTAIRTELERNQTRFSEETFHWLKFWINHELDVYKLYGGKIFAIGRVAGKPNGPVPFEGEHWKSRIYADIDNIQYLSTPIDISEFNTFIQISRQGAITAVLGENYDRLMALIQSKNKLPKSFKGLKCGSFALSKIDEANWPIALQRHRHAFFLEAQLRAYIVDHLLHALGDQRTFLTEVRCRKKGCPDTYVDNLVKYKGRWLPVEVKLDIDLEADLPGQLKQYMHVNEMVADKTRHLSPSEIWNDRVLVVDTEGVYLYLDDGLHYLLLWEGITSVAEVLEKLEARLGELCGW